MSFNTGFDPWDVSQQGLADLMKSERAKQQYHSSLPNQPSSNTALPGALSNGIGNGNPGSKSSLLQEEFKALFPNVNVSFEGKVDEIESQYRLLIFKMI